MRCPILAELPPPPLGQTGWPWTEESEQLHEMMPDGTPWPRVSIVTPTFNQAQFIEETIRSVLLQGYPNLEYVIIDGGSTDGSVDIIRKYEPWLAFWVSEPDRGQSDALTKGFRRATGSVVAWLNSDDWYDPNVIHERVTYLGQHSEATLVYGDCRMVNETGQLMGMWEARPTSARELLLEGNQIAQPSVFIQANALDKAGGIDPDLRYVMDWALWVQLSLIGELRPLPGCVASFRHHTSSKSVANGYKFFVEQLAWVERSSLPNTILADEEIVEMKRRLHVRAALEYVLAGNPTKAAQHISAAFVGGHWPYGGSERLAEFVVSTRGLNGQALRDSALHLDYLAQALQQTQPNTNAMQLKRHIKSLVHFRQVFAARPPYTLQDTGRHLFAGVWYNPRWLLNKGVLSICAQTLLGQRAAAQLGIGRKTHPRS